MRWPTITNFMRNREEKGEKKEKRGRIVRCCFQRPRPRISPSCVNVGRFTNTIFVSVLVWQNISATSPVSSGRFLWSSSFLFCCQKRSWVIFFSFSVICLSGLDWVSIFTALESCLRLWGIGSSGNQQKSVTEKSDFSFEESWLTIFYCTAGKNPRKEDIPC